MLKAIAERREIANEIFRQRHKTSGQPVQAKPEPWDGLLTWFYQRHTIQEDFGIVVMRSSTLQAFLTTVVNAERGQSAELAKQLGCEDVAAAIEDRPAPVWRQKAARLNGGRTNAKAA